MSLRLILVISICLTAAFIFACGEPAENGDSGNGEKKSAEEMTPEEIGKSAGKLYGEAIAEVVEFLKDKPEVTDEVKSKLEEIRESYIQKFVELGKAREKLDDAGKTTVDNNIRDLVYGIDPELHQAYGEIYNYYMTTDIANTLGGFNIITQYAQFDLLKRQFPEEAERLGIKLVSDLNNPQF